MGGISKLYIVFQDATSPAQGKLEAFMSPCNFLQR